MATGHVNGDSLSALLGVAARGQRSLVAQHASVSASYLADLASKRRLGTDPDLRERVAVALVEVLGLTDVNAGSISCWCSDPSAHHMVDLPPEQERVA